MPTISDVREQIAAYGHAYIFWTQKEIRALPEILDKGEVIKALTSGMVNGHTWLAVCTDRRLIFLNRGMFWGTEQIQMPLDRVQSIDHQFTFFFGQITVFDGVNYFTLRMVLKSSILPFAKATEEAMYVLRTRQTTPTVVHTTTQPTDVASQLAKLADLLEKGHLTEAEFEAQKRKLLG